LAARDAVFIDDVRQCRGCERAGHPRHPFPLARAIAPRPRGLRPSPTAGRDESGSHQSDHLDQRRHAGARRRHSARAMPFRARDAATPASSSAGSSRAMRPSWPAARAPWPRAGVRLVQRRARERVPPRRRKRGRKPSALLPPWAATSWCSPKATTVMHPRRCR
jgi:hypothetical protein